MVTSESKGSLTRRLIVSAAVVMVLFLGLTGYALDRAFYKSQIAAQGERLFIRVFNLLSVAELDDSTLALPIVLRDERFNSPESGLVGLVLDHTRMSIWESLSSEWFEAGQWVRSKPNIGAGEEEFGIYGSWVYQRNGFIWEDPKGDDRYFEFWVLENASPLNKSVQTFRSQLWGSLTAVTIALLIFLSLVTAWGLRPLRVLAVNLNRIRSGESDKLSGEYPKELTPLTNSLNQLIQAEQGQRERYRKAMGDLAHSLKTPLAVMRTISSNDQEEINEQVVRMDQIVRYQLQRAVTDARSGPVLGQRCDINKAVQRLGNALEKAFIHEDKVLDLPEDDHEIFVAMDSNDVLEVLGNLIENGFKYGRSVISVVFEEQDSFIQVHVDDDGAGVSEEQSKQVLTRGKRLDTMQPGQGIGLAMVNDILSSYRVELGISKSPLGGARFSLKLPRVT
jgi:two-component system sensor histidine kinase PhoQ